MNKETTQVAIPEIAFRHITIECGKVSRRFHLDDDDRVDLESHIRCEVRVAVANRYDPARGKVYTFVQGVVRNQLCTWMEKETRRREDFCSLAKLQAARDARTRMKAPNGRNDSVDDTSYVEEDRRDRGEETPAPALNGDAAWDAGGLRRLATIADVRQVVGELEGDSKRLCDWYLETESLRKTCERMRLDSKRFFMQVWPQAKADFIEKAKELGKHFEGQA